MDHSLLTINNINHKHILTEGSKNKTMAVEKRFLKYVSYWTTSEDDQESIPSTKRQFELAKVLEQELKELNLEKVKLDEHCYVYGLLPATAGMEGKKAVGFIAICLMGINYFKI